MRSALLENEKGNYGSGGMLIHGGQKDEEENGILVQNKIAPYMSSGMTDKISI